MTRPVLPAALLRPGQILLVRRRSLLGWWIRWVTGAQVNHSTLIYSADTQMCIGAEDLDGVRLLRLAQFLADPAVTGLVLLEVPGLMPEQRRAVQTWALDHKGEAYDTLQLLGIYARHRVPFLTPSKLLLDSTDKMICSEFVVRAFQTIGVDLCPPGVCVGMVDPGMLHASPKLATVWEWWAEKGR
jgi:hypothetical protein